MAVLAVSVVLFRTQGRLGAIRPDPTHATPPLLMVQMLWRAISSTASYLLIGVLGAVSLWHKRAVPGLAKESVVSTEHGRRPDGGRVRAVEFKT